MPTFQLSVVRLPYCIALIYKLQPDLCILEGWKTLHEINEFPIDNREFENPDGEE